MTQGFLYNTQGLVYAAHYFQKTTQQTDEGKANKFQMKKERER